MVDVLEITKNLILKPSYLDGSHDEMKVVDYIANFIRDYCPKTLKINYQEVVDNRCNLIVSGNGKPKLIFACHTDTVKPSTGGKYDPLSPSVVGDRLYGLGSKDMKGGLASLLAAVANIKNTDGLYLIFYVDEEYLLRGMKKFVEKMNFKPELVVSPESKFEIANGRRGIISVEFTLLGKTAHTARPYLGINAIEGAYRIFNSLQSLLSGYKHQKLGNTVCSLVFIEGGVRESSNQSIVKSLNVVPDVANFALNIRPACEEVTAKFVVKKLKDLIKGTGLKLDSYTVHHDYPSSFVPKGRLKILEQSIKESGLKPVYSKNIKISGFNDVALINKKTGADFVNFGPYGEGNHSPDEWVSISSLYKTQRIFEELIGKICT